ncbi:1,4-dihydroxy-2-naphthoate polyprenyltransferase, chloroplastic [Dorcoceras hygrometricum]|uniref:1,4-dihydroxy-2-naphthoate polyprenyltransferase, chloroplastic n=1 Tax=Dorcoceras hygrometricum TaxID=472368 RepID=A0A2Z7CTR4_9LAMI|nr:1,4-dihydroxy-2-naphthoate polyprenyltransferase, chloroplastic [Dorcoceras hygrometricum]
MAATALLKANINGNYSKSSMPQIAFGSCDKAYTGLLASKKQVAHPRFVLKCKAEVAEVADSKLMNNAPVDGEKEAGEELSRSTLIWRAAKLPMYTVALIPVLVGSAAAYLQSGQFSFWRFLVSLASFVVVNVWVNLSNDVYDFDTGADKDKKESIVNLFGSRTLINNIAWSLLVIGFSGISWVAAAAASPRSVILSAFAAFCFFLYQCPPFRLSYFGVGEPLLLLAYGPLATTAFYLLQSRTSELPITGTIIWPSLLIGFTTALILFCSHFHQIQGDSAVGKMSPLVRLGTDKGSKVVKFGVVGLYSLLLALGFFQALPFPSVILGFITLPMANLVVDFVGKNHKDKSKIFMSKYLCVRLHTVFGAALAAGLVIARMLAPAASKIGL